MASSQRYELRRWEKENQDLGKLQRRNGKRPSDEGVVALEEAGVACPQKIKVLDTHESPWSWEREAPEEELVVDAFPRKKENVRKKKRWEK